MAPQDFRCVRALERICRTVIPALPEVASCGARKEISRYLRLGGGQSERIVELDNGRAFLYLAHEAVELVTVREWLNRPARAAKVRPSVRPISTQTPDPWIRAFAECSRLGAVGPIAQGDTNARVVEARLEKFLARLLFGVDIELVDLVATTATKPSSSESIDWSGIECDHDDLPTGWADGRVRANTLRELPADPTRAPAGARNLELAGQARAAVWRITADELRAFHGVDVLAYAIWEGRGRPNGDDWTDWLAASEAFDILHE